MDSAAKYAKTIQLLQNNIDLIMDEIILFQKSQMALMGNDFYMIKGAETQAIFERVLCKNQAKIAPNNHQKAYDIKHAGQKISIKSGVVSNKELTFSYSRTTEQPTLLDKIDYLSTFENLILGIASEKVKSKNPNIINKVKYYLYYFPANQLDLKSMEWKEGPNQFFGVDDENNIRVNIKKKLSDQPWITLPTNFIHCEHVVTSSVCLHNNRKYLMISKSNVEEREYYNLYEHRKLLSQFSGMQSCSAFTPKAAMA